MSPHIVAREADIDLEIIKVDLSKHETADGRDFYTINPKGYIPALELDNGEVLTEGEAIVQYLADQKPEKKLIPAAGTFERYRAQEWLTFISTELHKNFGPLYNKIFSQEIRNVFLEKLAKRFIYLDKVLSDKPFLMGDSFTICDAYCFTVIRWCGRMEIDLSPYPHLKAYIEKIGERPAVQKAINSEV